jgi:hypothetical protein
VDVCYIGLIIIGILATMLMLLMALFGIAMIIAAPFWGKLVGIFFVVAMVIAIVSLWVLILN